MKNVSDKICTENQNTHFGFSNFFIFRNIYEIMWGEEKNVVERGRAQMATWRKRTACWILGYRHTFRKHITFPLHQWVNESISMLGHTYIDCLVTNWYLFVFITSADLFIGEAGQTVQTEF
jgi:hypothetical protein